MFEAVRTGPLGAVTDQPQAAQLVAIVLATFVMSGLSAALATGTVILRDGLSAREAARLLDTSYRTTSASEVVLGWVLTLAYATIGWWAALICATLVLVIWQAHDAREIARHDAMTGLLSRSGFDARLTEVLAGVRRGAGRAALLAIDLDGFKAVNDTYGHAAGDDVIREVGARLRRVDPADRRRRPAGWRRVRGPARGRVRHGRRRGPRQADPGRPVRADRDRARDDPRRCLDRRDDHRAGDPGDSIERLHALADHEMYLVKEAGGGVRMRLPGDPAPVVPMPPR